MIKPILKVLGKTVISGTIAFVFLTLLCYFYNNNPVSCENKDGSTDYKFEGNQIYFHGTEGFGRGKTNNDGFMNMFDYDDDMEIDVLIIGSSHMQALQVDMSQSAASKLNALMENETVYNIGVPSHLFLRCASNFRAAINKYHPTNYIVIETSSVSFSDEELALAISEEIPELPAVYIGRLEKIVDLIRRNPYLSLLKEQIEEYVAIMQAKDAEEAKNSEDFAEPDTITNENLLDDLLHKMSVLAEECGAKVIIAYHPDIYIDSDGTMNINADQNAIARFERLCDENGILFLDMSDRFKEEYESTYTLPYGFSNTPVGAGHMNKYGHAMMADELYNLILEEEQ